MKVALTGFKPTGTPHLGNYLGMIQPALELAEQHEALYFIADYHALTTVTRGREVCDLTYQAAATWIALGLDPERKALYRQSDVPEVCELAWILACSTSKGFLNRAHAYKAAVDANRLRGRDADAGVNAGLYYYPVLMAADILLPGADVVPVGLDQQQHVEFARDIASHFNSVYGPILAIPEPLIDERVATIPGIDGRKMSKSYDNVIPILASPEQLRKSVMRIVTDSRTPEQPKNPETDVIFQIYSHVAPDEAVEKMRAGFLLGGLGYAQAKEELFTVLVEIFAGARDRYRELIADRAELDRLLSAGAARVRARGAPVLARVREAVIGGH